MISVFKHKKCIQKATGKNVWNNVLKQCIAHATLAHCIMSGTDKVIGLWFDAMDCGMIW